MSGKRIGAQGRVSGEPELSANFSRGLIRFAFETSAQLNFHFTANCLYAAWMIVSSALAASALSLGSARR